MSILSPRTYWTAIPFGYEKLEGEKRVKVYGRAIIDAHVKSPFYMDLGIQELLIIISS